MIELKQLQYFVVSADVGSFSKAAEILYTTQPNVSKAIKALEEQLGFDLFERKSRGILLTAKGDHVYEYACKAIENVETLSSFSQTEKVEQLKISSNPSQWMAQCFAEFYNQYHLEKLQFRLYTASVEEIMKRLIQLIPIILGITLLSFTLMHTATGDAVDALYDNSGGGATEQVKAEKRAELGLDQPFLVQYTNWLVGIATGNMGTSYISNQPVFETFVSKLPATIYLTLTSILVTVVISIPLGILAAVKQNRVTDYLIRGMSFIGNSMPGFFVSLLLIYFFALKLRLFPVMGNEGWQSICLPTLTLAIAMAAKYTRQVRATVLEELNKDYVMGARARGVRETVILWSSVLKSAMLTIVTLLALSIGSLLGGTAIIESIFMWDGVGKLAVDSIMARDYPMIQAYVIWMALIYVLVNLVTDILYHYLDPRIRLEKEG